IVNGEIVDASTAEPMFGVTAIIRSINKAVRSDLDGKYSLTGIPDGDFEIEFIMPGMDTQKKKVSVSAGKPAKANVAMGFKKLQEVVVEGRASNDTEGSLLKLQKKSAAVSDGISAQQIAKTPDSSAGDVVRRVTGITLVGGKFVFVRGLGERYSNTILNGVPLSSPEPDKKVIPFDLFPAALLKNIIISKTFIPEESAEFSGGTVKIETKEYPDKFFLKVGLKQGYNNNTSLQDFKTYSGGGKDWIGLSEGNRKKPDTVDLLPQTAFTEAGRFEAGYNRSLIALGSMEFNNQWSPRTMQAPLNRGFDFSVGNVFNFSGNRKLGFLFAITYNNDFQYREERDIYNLTLNVVRAFPASGKNRFPSRQTDYKNQVWEETVNWGSVFNTTYELDAANRIHWKNFFSVNNDKTVRIYEGINYAIPYELGATKLNYVMRNILNSQLGGDHRFNILEKATKLDWKASFSEANRNNPDMRDTVYAASPGTLQTGSPATLIESTLSGSRFFSSNKDVSRYIGFNYEVPFKQWDGLESKLKVGYSALTKERSFEAEFFTFRSRDNNRDISGNPTTKPNYPLPPEAIYNPFNRGTRGYFIREETRATDSYSAEQKLQSRFAQVDMPLLSKLRFIGGARSEDNYQRVSTFSPFDNLAQIKEKYDYKAYLNEYQLGIVDPNYRKTTAINANKDILPSANLVFSPDDKTNFRVAATQTISRPDFREMSPFEYTDVFGGPPVRGNAYVKRTYIHNYDLRYEYYPGGDDFIGIGGFYKRMSSPIERVMEVDAQFRYTVQNAKGAYIRGLEFEARKGLGFIHASIEKFSVGLNTFQIKSEVELNDWGYYQLAELGYIRDTKRPTSLSRPLQGQSPYVYNINVKYRFDEEGKHTVTLLYNEFGKRINSVGGVGIPDTYERPVGMLDMVYNLKFRDKWDFKIAGRNLTDTRIKIVQEIPVLGKDETILSYRLGPTLLLLLLLAADAASGSNCDLVKSTETISAGDISTRTLTYSLTKGYLLNGTVSVPSGVTLTIEPGVCIYGSSTNGGALLVKAGGKIIANGTKVRPIVFTSDKAVGSRASGDWQGVIIQGKGIQTNGGYGATATGEGDVGTFGGSDDADSSGSLKYVRIEFGGKAFSPGNERNNLSMMSVGSGTTMEYIQVHKGLDDGFEWWGGKVNMKYLIATDNRDDNFDFADGYVGNVQYGIVHLDTNTITNDDTSRCIEGDGNTATTCTTTKKDGSGTCADPTFANVTCIGNGGNTKQGDAIFLRRGSVGKFSHFLVENWAGAGKAIDCNGGGGAVTATVSNVFKIDTTLADDLSQGTCTAAADATAGVTSRSITTPNYIPKSKTTVTALTGVSGFGSGFDNTTYAGGLDPAATTATDDTINWTLGWTSYPAN
ncbi:MAG: carboxypeptidase-like regulatory domain-containing protein, partial [Leptospira sp.]|nr:carboxypeptidase-like regulatory domain-containing protein [Leptospira sp.]